MSGIMNMFVAAKTTIATAVDAFFNRTTLLLNTSSTNGAQNNTFLDSSTNNFTITRNGNTTQGTFTPFSQTGWGVYFDGTDDRLTTSSALLAYSTGNASTQTATIEAMVYLNGYNASKAGADENAAIVAKGSTYMNFGINHLGNLILYHYDGSVRTPTSSGTVPLNTWTHVAVTLSGGVATFYINGSSSGTGTWYGLAATSDPVYIGEATGASASAINGYLSNLRISTTARTITVPTAPYTSDANTALLTCQSNRFVDNSSNGYAITVDTGTPSVQAFSPFAPTAAYDAAVVGGSSYIGTTGAYLTVTSQPLVNVNDWTVEFWMYPTQYNSGGGVFSASNGGGTVPKLNFYLNGTNFELLGYSGSFYQILNTTPPKINQWTYVSVSRSSSTGNAYLYYNGVLQGSAATFPAITGITGGFNLLSDGEGSSAGFYGYMSNVRVSNTARYTGSSYSVPTSLNTSDANTTLLPKFINSGIYDSTAKNVLETVGNAQVSTTQAKWGTTSMYFDGTGDYLKPYYPAPANGTTFSFGTGDFTVEFWMYPTSAPSNGMIMDGRGSGASGDMWLINWVNGVLSWYAGSSLISSSTVSTNTWTHVAICRSGTSTKMFLNGTQTGSTYTDTKNYTVGNGWPTIGASYNAVEFFTGYLDDLRITKYARYTANFTAPTAAFPLQ